MPRKKPPGIFDEPRWSLISQAALEAGARPDAVRQWKTRRAIPGLWHIRLLRACVERGISLTMEELMANMKALA